MYKGRECALDDTHALYVARQLSAGAVSIPVAVVARLSFQCLLHSWPGFVDMAVHLAGAVLHLLQSVIQSHLWQSLQASMSTSHDTREHLDLHAYIPTLTATFSKS